MERYGVGWSKQVAPNVLSRQAWRFEEVAGRIDTMTLTAWVRNTEWTEIQSSTCADLQPPKYWVDLLHARRLYAIANAIRSPRRALNAAWVKYRW
ncbi:DUF2848 family protein [Kibdelosporangium lantanae]|uniref:DUF2848 family protein n=1 Tax=Kibdelosporangium lantanae TaxID=1497396 RepID=A0ABW3MHW1_9PSEU